LASADGVFFGSIEFLANSIFFASSFLVVSPNLPTGLSYGPAFASRIGLRSNSAISGKMSEYQFTAEVLVSILSVMDLKEAISSIHSTHQPFKLHPDGRVAKPSFRITFVINFASTVEGVV
jgi:hypothetical protein